MSGYSKCPGCGNVTFTTSYGACYLCGAKKDPENTTQYYDPNPPRYHVDRVRQQRKLMTITVAGMLVSAVITILLILLFIRKG